MLLNNQHDFFNTDNSFCVNLFWLQIMTMKKFRDNTLF